MSTVLLFKLTLVLLLLFIIFNLAKALIQIVRQDHENSEENNTPISRYLGHRVLFSAIAVVLLMLALSSGGLDPNARPY
ncbi:DUF2909 family protein [Vibrio sp. CAU 1672]|uniref:DUF2909 family protein n=1 Tax=Vibrio sp. CAU 1672 TaxID=3032594 RepID=UPI0023DCD519|nr:DUF2909 family protein [Vibrio sp. CAU 1672]MDF2152728.1 DUF2909 family protein [Vibrio sp. CAU 1672]